MMQSGYWPFMYWGYGFFIILIIGVFILFYLKNNRISSSDYAVNDTAEEILKKKFVKGQITEEEYLRKIRVLSGKTMLDKD